MALGLVRPSGKVNTSGGTKQMNLEIKTFNDSTTGGKWDSELWMILPDRIDPISIHSLNGFRTEASAEKAMERWSTTRAGKNSIKLEKELNTPKRRERF